MRLQRSSFFEYPFLLFVIATLIFYANISYILKCRRALSLSFCYVCVLAVYKSLKGALSFLFSFGGYWPHPKVKWIFKDQLRFFTSKGAIHRLVLNYYRIILIRNMTRGASTTRLAHRPCAPDFNPVFCGSSFC